jgi:hypothetical protein
MAALTPSQLWKRMTPEQRLQASRAFWHDEQTTDDHVQAIMLIAQQKKFRPKTVLAFDADRKARHLASMPSLSDPLAARTLIAYHLADQRPMMAAFLDQLGIAHEDGLIQEENVTPDASKFPEAAAALAQQFPTGDVALYFNTLISQDPQAWGALTELPQLQESAGSRSG